MGPKRGQAPHRRTCPSTYCNNLTGRVGTFWTGRFGAVCFEQNPETLLKEAAYIEMNPVRAKMTHGPGEFPWSTWGGAFASKNSPFCRREICSLIEHTYGWHDVPFEIAFEIYSSIFTKGITVRQSMSIEEALETVRKAPKARKFDPVRVQDDLDNNREIPFTDLLWCWLRFLSNGHTLGEVDFDKTFPKKHTPKANRARRHYLDDGQYVYTGHPIRGPDIRVPST